MGGNWSDEGLNCVFGVGLVSELALEVVADLESKLAVGMRDTLFFFDVVRIRNDYLLDDVWDTFCKLIRNENQVANACIILSIEFLEMECQNKKLLEVPGDCIDSCNYVVLVHLNRLEQTRS